MLGTEVVLGPCHIVLWGSSSPTPYGAQQPRFSTNVCCGQSAGWIKMPHGTEVCLSPGHIVLDGDPAPPKGAQLASPIFSPCLLWPNGSPSQPISATADHFFNLTTLFAAYYLVRCAWFSLAQAPNKQK